MTTLSAISDQSTVTHPWAVLALAGLALIVWAIWVRVRHAGRKIDAALPALLNPQHATPCSVLACDQAGVDSVHGWHLCSDHAAPIFGRARRDGAR